MRARLYMAITCFLSSGLIGADIVRLGWLREWTLLVRELCLSLVKNASALVQQEGSIIHCRFD